MTKEYATLPLPPGPHFQGQDGSLYTIVAALHHSVWTEPKLKIPTLKKIELPKLKSKDGSTN